MRERGLEQPRLEEQPDRLSRREQHVGRDRPQLRSAARDGWYVTRRIALPWYSREDYPGILAVVADRHNFAATYDQWLMAAENNELVARQAGLEIH